MFQGVRSRDGPLGLYSLWYCMIGQKAAIAVERR